MPLSLLVPMVVIGIAAIAIALDALGLSRPATLRDRASARRAWLREFPDDPPTRVILSHDHHTALIRTPRGAGLVWPMGADTTARYLTGAHIRHTAGGLRIDLPDFTAPHIHVALDPDEAAQWPGYVKDQS